MNNSLLSVLDLKAFIGGPCGHIRSRLDMASSSIEIKASARYHHYTISQLMELLSAHGRATFRMEGREDVILKSGTLNEIGALLSTVPRSKEFKILFAQESVPTTNNNGSLHLHVDVYVCKFIKLSANTLKSKSNLGELFEIHRVPLFKIQRKSLGLDLK